MNLLRSILVLASLASITVTAQVPVVNTLSNLLALPVASNNRVHRAVDVLGFAAPGDWGEKRTWLWSPTNALATNGARLASTYLAAGSVGRWTNPEWDGDIKILGATCDGVTDDTVAINAAAEAARTFNKTLRFPEGTNYVTTTLWLTNVDILAHGNCIILTTNNTSTIVKVGGFDTSGAQIKPRRIEVPYVRLSSAYQDHTQTNGTGVWVDSARNATFVLHGTERFHSGIKLIPTSPNFLSYSTFFIGQIIRAKIGLEISYVGTNSFANDCTVFGPDVNSTYTAFGTRAGGYKAIYLHPPDSPDNWTDINNWRFYGPKVEGGAFESDIFVEGRANLFDWGRYETGTTNDPLFGFTSTTNSPATTEHNRIRGGFMSPHNFPDVSQTGTARGNSVDSESTVSAVSYMQDTAHPIFRAQNDAGGPAMAIYPSGANSYQSPTGYVFSMDHFYFRIKNATDANVRGYWDRNGQMGWGDGNNTLLTATPSGGSLTLNPTAANTPGLKLLSLDYTVSNASAAAGFLASSAGIQGAMVAYPAISSTTEFQSNLVVRTFASGAEGIVVAAPYSGQVISFMVGGSGSGNYVLRLSKSSVTNELNMEVWDNRLSGFRRLMYTNVGGLDTVFLKP